MKEILYEMSYTVLRRVLRQNKRYKWSELLELLKLARNSLVKLFRNSKPAQMWKYHKKCCT